MFHLDVVSVIISLIIIEGLLSIDNALAIAAMASDLPKYQQKLALKLGILGAYFFRGVALFAAAFIANNNIIKLIGASFLIYLMCKELFFSGGGEDGEIKIKKRGFFATVMAIELLDLSLSVDNVVAAVALDKRLWVVILGVFIGIFILRMLAGYCIVLIDNYPILKKTAYMLVGYVGILLLIELVMKMRNHPIEISPMIKFSGIALIVGVSMLYDHIVKKRKDLV